MVKNAQQMKRIEKSSENNAMYFHSEISAPKVYSNDTIKTVQMVMRKFLLFFVFKAPCPGTVQTIHRLHSRFLKLG